MENNSEITQANNERNDADLLLRNEETRQQRLIGLIVDRHKRTLPTEGELVQKSLQHMQEISSQVKKGLLTEEEADLQRAKLLATKDYENQKMLRSSEEDDKTSLLNEVGFNRAGNQLLDTSRKKNVPLVMVFLDLRQFKTVNDKIGHAAGDLILADVGDYLNLNFRANDVKARLHGDEFVVLCLGADAQKLKEKIINLRDEDMPRLMGIALESCGINLGGNKITMNVGVAEYNPGDSLDSLRKRADEAMNLDKAEYKKANNSDNTR